MEPVQGDTPTGDDVDIDEFLMSLPGMELKSKPSLGGQGGTFESLRKKMSHSKLKTQQIQLINEAESLLQMLTDIHKSVEDVLKLLKMPEPERNAIIVTLEQHLKTMQTRKLQQQMIIFLLENKQEQNLCKSYDCLFESLEKFRIPSQCLDRSINQYILHEIHLKQKGYLESYSKSMKDMHELLKKDKFDIKIFKNHLRNCRILNAKLYTLSDVYSYASLLPEDDLLSLDRCKHERWDKLKKIMNVRSFGDRDVVHKAFDEAREGLNFASAMLSKMDQVNSKVNFSKADPNNITEVLRGGFSIAMYSIMKDKAKQKAEVTIANPNPQTAISLWNLPQTGVMKNLVEMMLPNIAQSDTIYIPRHFPSITQEMVAEWNLKGNFDINEEDIRFSTDLMNRKDYLISLYQEPKKGEDRILTRINSPFYIEKANPDDVSFGQKFTSFFKKKNSELDTVIFHIHGGGFVSQSSFVHQMYVRRWANELGIPMISIDYRKAPVHPYPCGLDDCLQAYLWIINFFPQIFNIKVKKIILTGDSAGGNLVAALTCLLIKLKQRLPDGIVLVYPALNLNYDNYTPSLLACLDQPILPHTYLKVCLKSYIQNKHLKPEEDPFLSPVKCSDKMLSSFPPCRIFVGNNDPFHDDCCRLAERLVRLEKDVQLTIYDSFPHGFLQFDNPPKGNKFCRKAIDEVMQALRALSK